MKRMIALDGAQGEGGGQILRSALSLSMITGQPFTITGIRAGRAKPGLLRQHLTAVKAAAEICRQRWKVRSWDRSVCSSGLAPCGAAITALLSVAPEVVRWYCKRCCPRCGLLMDLRVLK